jgi:hypothetical protein
MPRICQGRNPLYGIVVIVGVLFTVTAFAYGVMAYREIGIPLESGSSELKSPTNSVLTEFMDKNGVQLMGWEVVLLAIASVLAMWSDKYWSAAGHAPTGLAQHKDSKAL